MAASILVVDNFDSFTFNLVQDLLVLGVLPQVYRNHVVPTDGPTLDTFDALLISPGPGRPQDAGRTLELLERWPSSKPLLGVCLGHQALAVHLGGRVRAAPRIMHGKTSPVRHEGRGPFAGLASPMVAMRYHSLVVDAETLPTTLRACAWSLDDDVVMALERPGCPWWGVQFHPESVLTIEGRALLGSFLEAGNLSC